MKTTNMERKPKKRHEPFNFGSGRGTTLPLINTRKTHRNDPCPCGATKIVSYPGTEFADVTKPVKFKNCCLNELGPQINNIRSTKDICDEKAARKRLINQEKGNDAIIIRSTDL